MIVIIEDNLARIKVKDNPKLPWVLECRLRAPEFERTARPTTYRDEYIKIRADTEEELQVYAARYLAENPRTLEVKIYKP